MLQISLLSLLALALLLHFSVWSEIEVLKQQRNTLLSCLNDREKLLLEANKILGLSQKDG